MKDEGRKQQEIRGYWLWASGILFVEFVARNKSSWLFVRFVDHIFNAVAQRYR
ncbi:hypothetical protein JOD20_000914 [Herpetosiphon giganteus]|nr:hypothetical protein [Herpetosiphon giganteus]